MTVTTVLLFGGPSSCYATLELICLLLARCLYPKWLQVCAGT